MATLSIHKQMQPIPNPQNVYRIAETVTTVDGPRTRLTHHSFPTLAQARRFVREHK